MKKNKKTKITIEIPAVNEPEKFKKPSVTVAVSAFNEEKNIKFFLDSVLSQKQNNYKMRKILVLSDGSTDRTCEIVLSYRSPVIRLVSYKERIGKSSRLNEIYRRVTSDILVQSDCDVVFAGDGVIASLIRPLLEGKKVGMCGGNPLPVKGETFIENAINYSCEAYNIFRQKVRKGNNVFSADGRLLAFKKKVFINTIIPYDMIANDMFMYFATKTKKFEYRFVKEAIVTFRSPTFFADHIQQNTRFVAAPLRMKKYFDVHLVDLECSIPKGIYFKTMLFSFVKHPLHCSIIYVINLYCKVKARQLERKLNALWYIANSTKNFVKLSLVTVFPKNL
jgi:glycosyltransferase involved in cell wall biosynthesis